MQYLRKIKLPGNCAGSVRMTFQVFVEINGIEMSFTQVCRHVQRTRGYRLTPRLLLERYKAGLGGEMLIEPPSSVKPKWPTDVVPVSVPGWGSR
jgi:hypothetical protein